MLRTCLVLHVLFVPKKIEVVQFFPVMAYVYLSMLSIKLFIQRSLLTICHAGYSDYMEYSRLSTIMVGRSDPRSVHTNPSVMPIKGRRPLILRLRGEWK